MKNRDQIRKAVLLALRSADGVAMPHTALVGSCLTLWPKPTIGEVNVAIKELETELLIDGANTFNGLSWVLTVNGIHQAQQL